MSISSATSTAVAPRQTKFCRNNTFTLCLSAFYYFLIIMSISSSTSMAVATRQRKYDVFLNFRGGDTRRGFLSHLHEALVRAKLETFIDEKLMKGKETSPALLEIIEESHVAVTIFSKDYASSPWCLEELEKIIECCKYKGQIVIPVFYYVSLDNVRQQGGLYAEAFAKHEKDPENARYVPQWKAAMTTAAKFNGRSAWKASSESELVKQILNDVLKALGRPSVGTDSTVETGSLCVKVAHNRIVEIQVPGGPRVTKSEDLPVDHLVSSLETLQHLFEASLQSLENSNADLGQRHASAPSILGYAEECKNAGPKSGTVLNNKAEIVQASASAPKLSDYAERSKNAGSGSCSSTRISSLPTNSEFCLPGAEDRIVLYVTSSEVITKTFEDCNVVRKILRRFEVPVDERDIAESTHRKELQSALKGKTMSLPLLFIKGEYIGGAEEIKQLKETGQLGKLIEGVSVAGDGRIDSSDEQAPKRRSCRRVEHNEESKNVIPLGSSGLASSSEPQAPPIQRPWRRVEHNDEESKNGSPVGWSEVAAASEPRAPNPRSWRRLAHALARNLTPVGSSAVSFYVRTKQSLSFFFFFLFFGFFFF